ncbi:MAG TPA: RNA 2'-phosphotransferase [Chitinophagales bacterium]|nr:RNA 2'-phosphotransferase [Chitinophagales bacterium]
MNTNQQHKNISKFLSLVLRHMPDTISLNLDENGWADISELIEKCNNHNVLLNIQLLEEIVTTNDKQRFAFNDDKSKIRANQGHSITVELDLEDKMPPEILYHGTAERFLGSILKNGILKQSRQQVHLSANIDTAKKVGARHGKPVVLTVKASAMYNAGHKFYLSQNGVWLTDFVHPEFLIE